MSSPLDTRLDRQEGRRTAGAAEQSSAALRRRHTWRAAAAIGTVIRSALARAGVDAARATRLCLADEAAAALVALSDTPETQRADSDGPAAEDCVAGDAFKPKRLTENELSDFSRLWHDGCGKAIIEIQDVDRNHSPEI